MSTKQIDYRARFQRILDEAEQALSTTGEMTVQMLRMMAARPERQPNAGPLVTYYSEQAAQIQREIAQMGKRPFSNPPEELAWDRRHASLSLQVEWNTEAHVDILRHLANPNRKPRGAAAQAEAERLAKALHDSQFPEGTP